MGSVLALKSFKQDFGLPTESSGFSSAENAHIASNVVSLLTAGCFFGAITAAFINERFGRRYALMLFTIIFLVGAAIQTSASHSIGQIYGGRVIAGFGIGGMSAITPVFVSENCPPATRGRVAGLFQEFLVIGSTFAYWLDYGVALNIKQSTKQWRIPVGLQLVPGGLMLCGLFFLKESPRWLMKKSRHEEALRSLSYIRNEAPDSPEVLKELAEIRAAIEEEMALTEGVTWKECLKKGNWNRFALAFGIMFWQQFSGTNSIGYYAPEIFETVGVSSTNSSLFATGVYGTVKVVATALFLILGIDRLGRKKSLIAGAIWMAIMMFIIGAVLATHPPNSKSSTVSPASIAMVVMIYLYVIGYSASWGPTPWVYVSEVRRGSLQSITIYHLLTISFLFSLSTHRFSLPVYVNTASVSPPQRSGCSTLSLPKSPLRPSTTLAGAPLSCLDASAAECAPLSSCLSRRPRAARWRTWTSCLASSAKTSARQTWSMCSIRASSWSTLSKKFMLPPTRPCSS